MVESRQEAYDYLDDYSRKRARETREHNTTRGLITSYLLEYHDGDDFRKNVVGDLVDEPKDFEVHPVEREADFYGLVKKDEEVGYIERLSGRHLMMHSVLSTEEADMQVGKRVRDSARLDSAWFSGGYLERMWRGIALAGHPHRNTKLKFAHKSEFDEIEETTGDGSSRPSQASPTPKSDEEREAEQSDAASWTEEQDEQYDRAIRMSSVSEISERSEVLSTILPQLQDIYPPYKAIRMFRFPAPFARGGYDLYSWGKMTYRANSFREGRSLLRVVTGVYERLTRYVERKLWFSMETTEIGEGSSALSFEGAPLTIKFGKPLSEKTFQRFVERTFRRGSGPFKLWGNPISVGSRKFHVYGIDKHLWQKVYLEITPEQMLVILPKGTCGNTAHRLITNVQRYLSPEVEAYVGAESYAELVDAAFEEKL